MENQEINTAYKQRQIVPRRDGTDRIEYWVIGEDKTISTCSPMVWSKIALPDRTTERMAERVAKVRYTADRARRPFGRRVEDNQWLRANNIPADSVYRALCNQFGIRY